MKKLTGLAASPGIVIGRAYVVYSESFRILPREISDEDVAPEIERFRKAIAESKDEILSIQKTFREQTNEPALAEIFDTHIHLLEDLLLTGETIKRVREEKKNVEFIFSKNLEVLE